MMHSKWLMGIVFIVITSDFLLAKRNGVCIPINEISIVKKAILTLDLNREQKSKIIILEETLKEQIQDIRSKTKKRDDSKLSTLFNDSGFMRKEFMTIAATENTKISDVIAVYFEKLYAMLDKAQQKDLIERFKRIEKRAQRSEKRAKRTKGKF